MAILALHHCSIIVSDTRRALEFYHDLLGIDVDDSRPELGYPGAWLNLGPQQIHLMELPNPDLLTGRPEHGGRDRHLALLVDNLDKLVEKLESLSITYTLSKSGRKALFCRDFDANAVEIIEKQQ